jgi:hypothetical protein
VLCIAAWLGSVGVVSGASTVTLHLASVTSQEDQRSVTLIFTGALSATTAASPANYGFIPARTIESIQVDGVTSNIVYLRLAAASPLIAGTNYQARVLGGKDAWGETLSVSSATFTAHSVQTEAVRIKRAQLPDGAISLSGPPSGTWVNGNPVRIVPYFACHAVEGLVSAWRMTGDRSNLESARLYFNWHASHMNPDSTIYDYTGTYPNYSSTGDYDSTDSYGALFLMALWHYYVATGDTDFVAGKWAAIGKAAAAMDLTLQSDNLTWAKPTYQIKYTMDNCEVFQGYFAAARLAETLGHAGEYQDWISKSEAVKTALRADMWRGSDSPPRYAVHKGQGLGEYWNAYYPGGMANDFATMYVHEPSDARVQAAWQATRDQFLPGYVPDSGVTVFAAFAALRAGDPAGYAAAFASTQKRLRQSGYTNEAGLMLQLAAETRGAAAVVPVVQSEPVIDGLLNEAAWQQAGRLWFHRYGVMVGADNRETYDFPGNAIDPDGSTELSFVNLGRRLFVGITSHDRYLTSGESRADSDGLSHLYIRDPVNTTTLHDVSYTFFTDGGVPVTAPTAGGALAALPSSFAEFTFLPGTNSVNQSSDVDSGYRMELKLDLGDPALGAFPAGPSLDLTFGLRIADMDGTPAQPWPWSNGAYGTMMQLSPGLAAADYSRDMLRLPVTTEPSGVGDWILF